MPHVERPEQLLRELRKRTKAVLKRGVRREALAYESGVTYSWLCKFLAEHRDARNPTLETLAKLDKRVSELERLQ